NWNVRSDKFRNQCSDHFRTNRSIALYFKRKCLNYLNALSNSFFSAYSREDRKEGFFMYGCYPSHGHGQGGYGYGGGYGVNYGGSSFVLIVVLFILLIIVGRSYF